MSSERAKLVRDISQRIMRTTERAAQMSNAAAAVIGVNTTDMACIQMLQSGPLTAGEMARRTGLTTAAMTTVIDRLEQAGFVTRRRDPQDRRRVIVAFRAKEAGPGIAPVFQPLLSNWRAVMADYDERDLGLIAEFLGRIENALTTEIDNLRNT